MGLETVELFAGVGGFRLGLERAGHEIIWSNQWEPSIQAQHASDCYAVNFGEENHTNVDINEVDETDVPDHDLLVGGFPCQDYSVAQTGAQGIEGEKGVLWWEIERIVREKRPPLLLLENVNRLLRSPTEQRGRDFGVVLHCLHNLGYNVEWRMINAADYGYATKRRRVFIFAARRDTEWGAWLDAEAAKPQYFSQKGFFPREFPVKDRQQRFPMPQEPDTSLLGDPKETSDSFEFHFKHAGAMVAGDIWTEEVDPDTVDGKTLGDVLERDGVSEEYFLNEEDIDRWEYIKGAKEEERVTDEGYEYTFKEGAIPFPDKLDEPSRTLLTSEGTTGVGRVKHVVEDPKTGDFRILTPKEAERLMDFPDDWTDTGMPETWRYTCMGNALVVGLVEQMGRWLNQQPDAVETDDELVFGTADN
ncbi:MULTISPECIES: DNA (cytosine-5-)-methyltransferase [Haloferax]|uniref:DNA (cytosine-5-)-methyltransferase n=2 Tax=Haloferax TaxID=2251 RepID=A0A6G1Z7M0_9EURY|nr:MULTISPECIES: DNA (cytosine-5-)-methyltransferase [Haloferax]KAB1184770.1 DNA (cytosine-5-)-methyltransferase [Haloferax sp. CBA1149]MRW82401.1 DNA (cytosine-5-)-methyltransferase [Haloferax marinisediminis]